MKRYCIIFILIGSLLFFGGCSLSVQDKEDAQATALEYSGYNAEPYEVIHNNEPDFTDVEKKNTEAFEEYAPLDSLGRCGVAYANICREIMPTQKRGEIGQVKPSGWHTVKYDIVDGKYLYNRCHLIGYQLAGENANEKNLITGTRYLNIEGMLPFEDQVADYVKDTGNHVLYRVTPQYQGDDLVAQGVQMEGYSVEDQGEGVCFNIFAYNVQPGVTIDYTTGESEQTDEGEQGSASGEGTDESQKTNSADTTSGDKGAENSSQKYVINKNTKKFHDPSCSSVEETLAKNRKEVTESRETLIEQGYEPCGRCKP